jgi:hypothetical protein
MLKAPRFIGRGWSRTIRALWLVALLQLLMPVRVEAYIDPGVSGLMAQFLYVLFYGALAIFFYFLQYLKSCLTSMKEFLAKLFSRRRY